MRLKTGIGYFSLFTHLPYVFLPFKGEVAQSAGGGSYPFSHLYFFTE